MKAENKNKIRIITLTILVGLILMGVKFYAWGITGSAAIFSDALESFVNIVSGCLVLFSVVYASRPKDKSHPYGHGKIEFLSAGFEGGLILLAGLSIIYTGAASFIHQEPLSNIESGFWLTLFSGVINGLMGFVLITKGKKQYSDAMYSNGKHLMTDALTSLALVLGIGMIWLTGLEWIDGLIAIIFGVWIIFSGFKILSNSIQSLLDRADEEKLKKVIKLLNENRREKWIDIHNLRIQKYGSQLHIDCHLTLPWYDSLEESHKEVHKVEKIVHGLSDQEVEFFIHTDPCLPDSCSICQLSNCPERKHEMTRKLEWTLENLIPDIKHSNKTI